MTVGSDLSVDSATAQLVAGLEQVQHDALGSSVTAYARHCLLDWMGVTIAGASEPLSRLLQAQSEQDAFGAHRIIGTRLTASASWAALLNGAASHALDYDDVVTAMGGHPSVPVIPALMALAGDTTLGGKRWLAAFAVGIEAECRVGAAVAPGHYANGFHATGTIGTFGAAAACAHALALDGPSWRAAIGLAATQAAGLKCMFGTMAKPFHAGKAAANGLLAARLAARGFTAHEDAIATHQGFAATQTPTYDAAALDASRPVDGITHVLFKFHAACYLTHASIDAAREAALEGRPIVTNLLEQVQVRVPPGHLSVCNIVAPDTGLAAKFSLAHVVAMALLGRSTDHLAFTDACARDPDLVALRQKVRVEPVPDLPNNYCSDVVLHWTDGSLTRASADVSRPAGQTELPGQWARLCDKFRALSEPVVGPAASAELIQRIAALDEETDMCELLLLTRPNP